MRKHSKSVWRWLPQLIAVIGLAWSLPARADAQERRVKARISNAGFTITALPLLAAKDWGIFCRQWVGHGGYSHAVRVGARGSDPGRYRLSGGRWPRLGQRDIGGLSDPRHLVFLRQDLLLVDGQAAIQNSRKLKGEESLPSRGWAARFTSLSIWRWKNSA